MASGKFITFEGCEGVGKSTQVRFLSEYLNRAGREPLVLREPGGTHISEEIRRLLLDPSNKAMAPEAEALLYAASRAQLVAEVIKPAVAAGRLVICDRFVDSSLAYQGYARGLGADRIEKLNEFAVMGIMPDLTLYLDLSPDSGFLRKGGRDTHDRLELENADFHKRVYEGYLELARRYPARVAVINTSGSKQETHEQIISLLKARGII